MGETGRAVVAILSSIVGLSIVAVLLSTRSNTAGVLGAAGSALSQVIGAATSPVTGAAPGIAGLQQGLMSGGGLGGGYIPGVTG